MRVERALGRDLGEPFLRERVGERAVDEPDALLELRLLVLGGRLERALEVVEHRHELLDEPLVGARGQLLLVARHPLAVVVELGLQPLQRVEVLVALTSCACGELVDGLDGLGSPRLRPRSARRSLLVDHLVLGVLDDLVVARPSDAAVRAV